jgi:hypothetical protein
VCRYPLLLSELLKHTPVIDCPYSHMVIENALIRFREATAEINRATTDSRRAKSVLKKTWTLQDRLAFPGQVRVVSSPFPTSLTSSSSRMQPRRTASDHLAT